MTDESRKLAREILGDIAKALSKVKRYDMVCKAFCGDMLEEYKWGDYVRADDVARALGLDLDTGNGSEMAGFFLQFGYMTGDEND